MPPKDTNKEFSEYEKRDENLTGEQRRNLSRAIDSAVDFVRGVPGTIFGNKIVKDFEDNSKTSLIGQKVNGLGDMAILGQIFRNPAFETVRYFFVKNNEIIHTTGVTSRLPGSSALFAGKDTPWENGIKNIADTIDRLGADGLYMFHNHPTGDPTPSRADIYMEGKFRDALGDKLVGSVIINHTTYATVSNGVVDVCDLPSGIVNNPARYKESSPASVGHALLGEIICSPGELASLAATIVNKTENSFQIIAATPSLEVVGLIDFPCSAIDGKSPLKLIALAKKYARATGGCSLFAVNIPNTITAHLFQAAIKNGVLVDAHYQAGLTLSKAGARRKGSREFGRENVVGYQVREGGKRQYSIDAPVGFNLFGPNIDKAYDLILDATGCGPFDGGCVTMAMALQRTFGGEIYVLERANGLADHAVVKVGAAFYDFDGRAESEREIIARFNENENVETIRARPITGGDLTEAPRDAAAAVKISRLVDGWMLAPNGKPTRLDEQQWLLVRTPAFKKWFGDWEHEPASASKVVDKNGEPMVMYHGTRCEFSTFKRNRKRPGIFFHSDPESAGQYSNGKGEKRIIPVFLRAVNPWDFQIKAHLAPAVKALPGEKDFSSWMKRELRIGDWEMIEKKSVQAVIAAGDHDSFFVNDRPGKALAVYSPKQIMILGDGRCASVDHSLDRSAKEDLISAPQTSNFSPEALLRGFTAHPSLSFKEALARGQQGQGGLPEEKIKPAPGPGMSA